MTKIPEHTLMSPDCLERFTVTCANMSSVLVSLNRMVVLMFLDETQINTCQPDLTGELKRWLCCQKAKVSHTRVEPKALPPVELVKMFCFI